MRKKDVTKAALNKPKARVTQADVYAALWKKEQADAERYAELLRGIFGLNERMTAHENAHTASVNEVVAKEVKLDAKKAGIAATFVAIIAGLVEVLRRAA